MRKGELEADKDKMMREYRAQLDAERAIKLSKGRNHSSSKPSRRKGIHILLSLFLYPSFKDCSLFFFGCILLLLSQ